MVQSKNQVFIFACFVISSMFQTTMQCGTYKVCEDREYLDESFYMLPKLRNDVPKMAKRANMKDVVYTHVHGDMNCNRSRSRRDHVNCPVYYELNMNPLRKPTMIVEARCSCADIGLGACTPDLHFREVLEYDQSEKCYRRILRRFQVGCSNKITPSFHR